jgi:hypothetical protein
VKLKRDPVLPCPLPARALLARYRQQGAFTDCYTIDLAFACTHVQYVAAFYTTPLFKIERLLLTLAVSRPSTDAQAGQLAQGTTDRFAAWHAEERRDDQLLLCDLSGRTRSWLMTESLADGRSRLYFGSAVVPAGRPGKRANRIGLVFGGLLGFHRLYSRLLLRAAATRLRRQAP